MTSVYCYEDMWLLALAGCNGKVHLVHQEGDAQDVQDITYCLQATVQSFL